MSLSLLADAVLKGTLLLATAFLFGVTLRRSSAAARHLLWSVALLGVIVLPVLSNTLPWRLNILPTTDDVPRAAILDASAVSPWIDDSRTPERPAPTADSDFGAAPRAGATDAPHLDATNRRSEIANPGVTGSAIDPSLRVSWRSLIPLAGTVWLVGVVLALARLAFGSVGVWALARKGAPLTAPPWVNALTQATMRLGIYRPVRLVVSDRAPMPFTTGYLAPLIVLPAAAGSWDHERRQAVLLHELAHLRRADFLTHLVAQTACAIYWFHPLVWAAARRMRTEGERACDDLVLEAGTRPSDYAGHLLEIVRTAGRSWAPVIALPMAQASDFEGRLLAILQPGVKRHPLTPLMGMAIVSSLTVTAIPLAALGPARQDASASDQRSTMDPGASVDRRVTAKPLFDESAVVGNATTGEPLAADPITDASTTDPVIADPAGDIGVASGGVSGQSRSPALSQQARDHAAALVRVLRDADAGVRGAAANALGNLQDTAAVTALIRTLQSDTSAAVRRAAAWALGEMGDARAVPALGRALTRDNDVEVRSRSALALGQIEDAGAVDALSSAMNDASLEVRRAAIHALGQIEDRRAVPALSSAVRDSAADVRQAAIHALGQIQDPTAVTAIQPALQDGDDEVRKAAVWALGQLEDARAVDPLLAALASDGNADVRQQAAWALGQIESNAAVPGLGRAMRDANAEVRRTAVWALGQIEDASALDALLPALRDQDVEVRRRAAWALGQIEDRRAVEPLSALLNDQDAEVRRTVVWALGQIQDPSSQAVLSTALRDQDVEVRRRAAWAIGQLDLTTAPPALLAALDDQDSEVRASAIHAIGQIEDAAAVPALSRLFDGGDLETRRGVIWALSQIHAPASYELLVRALQDEDAEIRRLAAHALGQRE